MHGRYVTDIFKMCIMKNFNAENTIFDNFTGFLIGVGGGGYTVSLACSQFLVVLQWLC